MAGVAEPRMATRLGSYEILHMFARGGMAELYLARSVGLEGFQKLVVLKKILPSFAKNPKFVRLFLDEAKLAASLDHPSIAHVYDLGLVDDNYFFTMEYVHGQDVRSILQRATRKGKLPIEHVVHVARSTASALHYAHERRGPDGVLLGIVHRDVSPSNIFVSYDGAVKLLDFGVAKAATSTVKTRTGALKGKVSYMSPEQAKGAPIDRRSDIFSTGIVMWEMVATKRLFKAENDLATLQLVLHQPPPALTELRADCPKELDRIIHRALAQDPEQRYQTAQELQRDLDQLALDAKLNQSSIALGAQMGVLFEPEINAWTAAQGRGVSLAEHIVALAATPVPMPTGSEPFDESEQEQDELDDQPELAPNVEIDGERTEQTAPPVAPPVAVVEPVAAVAAPPVVARPKRKKAKEPAGWATEPSIVVEDTLIGSPAPPIVPAVVPERPSRRDLVAALDTQLVSVVAQPATPRRRLWYFAGTATAIAAAVAVIVLTQSSSSPEPTIQHAPAPTDPTPPANEPVVKPAEVVVQPAEPPPHDTIATPEVTHPPHEVAKSPDVATPHELGKSPKPAKPIHHAARPPTAPKKPDVKPAKPKFDPDAPLPPM